MAIENVIPRSFGICVAVADQEVFPYKDSESKLPVNLSYSSGMATEESDAHYVAALESLKDVSDLSVIAVFGTERGDTEFWVVNDFNEFVKFVEEKYSEEDADGKPVRQAFLETSYVSTGDNWAISCMSMAEVRIALAYRPE